MSQILIQQYLNELADLRRVSGTERESVVREAFKTLLKGWGRSRDLIFVPEYEYMTAAKDRRVVDGALLHTLRVPLGYTPNLKREFPRIPYYADFWKWADWGEALMKLHLEYETVKPWGLKR